MEQCAKSRELLKVVDTITIIVSFDQWCVILKGLL